MFYCSFLMFSTRFLMFYAYFWFIIVNKYMYIDRCKKNSYSKLCKFYNQLRKLGFLKTALLIENNLFT